MIEVLQSEKISLVGSIHIQGKADDLHKAVKCLKKTILTFVDDVISSNTERVSFTHKNTIWSLVQDNGIAKVNYIARYGCPTEGEDIKESMKYLYGDCLDIVCDKQNMIAVTKIEGRTFTTHFYPRPSNWENDNVIFYNIN